jgi:glycosyltransferase involved in cell wall biosynthesis
MDVCFTFLGPLQYRGRLFKQIKTLQSNGHRCTLIHGQTEASPPDYSKYKFPVLPVKVNQERNRFVTLTSQIQFARKAANLILKSGVSTVVCVALQSALSGAIAKKKNPAIRYIFDNNELSLEMIGSSFKRKVWSIFHSYIIKHADVIMHAEQRRLDYFTKSYHSPAQHFLLENLPFYRAIEPRRRDNDRTLKCVYLGGLMPGRYCEEMLLAFSQLRQVPVTFDLVGFFSPQSYETTIRDLLGTLNTERISVLPPVSHGDMYDFLASYDIGLAFYRNTNLNNYYCAPNKVYDYIQLQIPVITNDYPGLLDVVQHNKIGVCIPEVNSVNIQNAIRCVQNNDMYSNINENIRKRYSWEHQENKYLALFSV